MENCRRRHSSSVSVLLPTGDSGNGVTVQQESIPGRESWSRDTSYHLHDSKHLARPWYHRHSCLCSSGAGRWRFFNRSTVREAVLSLYRLIQIRLCFVIFVLWLTLHDRH